MKSAGGNLTSVTFDDRLQQSYSPNGTLAWPVCRFEGIRDGFWVAPAETLKEALDSVE